jgi:hypothetical protein
MAKPKSVDAKINALTRLVEKGFAAISSDIAQLPTHSDVREIAREVIREEVPPMIEEALTPIRRELAVIARRLDALDEQFANIKGVTKEIDELRDRLSTIEKHLGIDKKIAA